MVTTRRQSAASDTKPSTAPHQTKPPSHKKAGTTRKRQPAKEKDEQESADAGSKRNVELNDGEDTNRNKETSNGPPKKKVKAEDDKTNGKEILKDDSDHPGKHIFQEGGLFVERKHQPSPE